MSVGRLLASPTEYQATCIQQSNVQLVLVVGWRMEREGGCDFVPVLVQVPVTVTRSLTTHSKERKEC